MNKKFIEILKILLFVTGAIAASVIASETVKGVDLPEVRILIREFLTCTLVVLLFILFTKYWERKKLVDSVVVKGSNKLNWWLKGTLLGAIMIVLTTVFLLAFKWISIETSDGWKASMIFPFITMFFTAFWEELVFRGYALNKLQKLIGVHTAAIGVALLFALLHLLSPLQSPTIVISTFFSGLLLNYAFIKKRSLYFPIGIHFAWNAINNFLFGKAFFKVAYHNELMAGIKNPEQGIVAITITGLALFTILFYSKIFRINNCKYD